MLLLLLLLLSLNHPPHQVGNTTFVICCEYPKIMMSPLSTIRLFCGTPLLLFSFLDSIHAQDGDGIRIIVSYLEDSYIDEAIQEAIGNELNLNITSKRILSFNITSEEDLERIQNSPLVEFAEIDPKMDKLIFGNLEPRDIEDNFLDIPTRDFEVTPYGIPMVQADLLKDIPVVAESMPVCVVDTGMDLGHPVSDHLGGILYNFMSDLV